MNRIEQAIARTEAQIKAKNPPADQRERLNRSLDMDLTEHAHFQELKSAVTGQLLSLEEATLVYQILGPTCEHFNSQPVAQKAVVTKLMAELLQARMAGVA